MSKTIQFTVPMVPPSVNHYVKHTRKGKHYQTGEALAFKDAVAIYLRGQFVEAERFKLTIRITLGHKDRGDWDNFPKLVGDALAAAGAFRKSKGKYKGKLLSDAHVRDGRVILDCDARPEQGYTEITIGALK